jgi:hypothetical protein
MSIAELIALFEDSGEAELAGLIRKYQHNAQIVASVLQPLADTFAEFMAMLAEEGDSEEAAGELTDKQAWTELAKLVKKVGAEQSWPEKLITALHDAFLEEARKA